MNSACLICEKDPVAFSCQPCGCAILCRGCAMRMATGGKWRRCGKFFIGCGRVQQIGAESDSSDNGGASGSEMETDDDADST